MPDNARQRPTTPDNAVAEFKRERKKEIDDGKARHLKAQRELSERVIREEELLEEQRQHARDADEQVRGWLVLVVYEGCTACITPMTCQPVFFPLTPLRP